MTLFFYRQGWTENVQSRQGLRWSTSLSPDTSRKHHPPPLLRQRDGPVSSFIHAPSGRRGTQDVGSVCTWVHTHQLTRVHDCAAWSNISQLFKTYSIKTLKETNTTFLVGWASERLLQVLTISDVFLIRICIGQFNLDWQFPQYYCIVSHLLQRRPKRLERFSGS